MTSNQSKSRVALRLGFGCDNACLFCAQGERDEVLEGDSQLLEQLRAEHDEISFVGGEPTLDPRLHGAIRTARELGFEAVGIQTNALRLAREPDLFGRLVGAGLSDVHLSIHGPSAESHDLHTSTPGSLAANTEVIARSLRAGLRVVVTTVVTRSNLRELPKMASALKRRGVSAWLIEIVRPYGRAADNFARLVPRFGMALPWALHGLEQARRNALSAWIRGAPLCGLGPFASAALPDAARSYPPPCAACPTRGRCPGVDPAYLEVFGHAELKPVAAPALAPFDAGRQQLIRMFVGVGERAERPPVLRSPRADPTPAAPADHPDKLRLPVLANNTGPGEPSSRSDAKRDE